MDFKTGPALAPGEARTIQWAPNPQQQQIPAGSKMKAAQANIGACDACRARKVRCLANESSMSSKCQRCDRAGRDCVYTVHSKTRRRRRTDTRVKELEEKVRNLSVLLEQGKNGSTTSGSKQGSVDRDEGGFHDEYEEVSDEDDAPFDETAQNDGGPPFDGIAAFDAEAVATAHTPARSSSGKRPPQNSQKKTWPVLHAWGGLKKPLPDDILPDVVDRGLLTMAKATELFDRYVNVLSPNYPAVVFPQGTAAADVRAKRPILFLAVLAAGAGTSDPSLNLKLNQEILQIYATKVALQGQKNLDLVQSILISTLWYYPPERFEELRFHQYIHMASTMALDIGLGKRPRKARGEVPRMPTTSQDYEPQKLLGADALVSHKNLIDSSAIECRRTLLACYLQCASVSMSLRLPNALRFTSFMAECVDVLETSPDAAPTDKRFTAWIRIQRIVEQCVMSFSLDDPGSAVSLEDIRVKNQLKGYAMQMQECRETFGRGVVNSFLEINYHVNNVYMHEISLHPDHDAEDFRPPFCVATDLVSRIPASLDPAYVNAILECVSSAKTVVKIFLAMDIETIRAVPALLYVRVIYSSVVLIKLEISANARGSQVGKILDSNSLNVRSYMTKTLTHLTKVVGMENKNILAAKFLMIFKKLTAWYMSSKSQLESGNHPQPFGPRRAVDPPTQAEEPGSLLTQSEKALKMDPKPHQLGPTTPGPYGAPPNSFQPFSGLPQPSPGPGKTFSDFSSFSVPPNSTSDGMQHFSNDPTIAENAASPSDYSSPEYHPPGSTIPFDYSQMEVDPSMFGQLQDAEPFTYNPDPNDWMFDGTNFMNVPDFEWNPVVQ